jgi:hypothetical protein
MNAKNTCARRATALKTEYSSMRLCSTVCAALFSASLSLPAAIFAAESAPTSPGVPPNFVASGIARANYYRAMAKLPPLTEDPKMSAGAYNHARYLVKHGTADGDVVLSDGRLRVQLPQDASKWEAKGRSFYSDEGAAAGRHSLVVTAKQIDLSGTDFIDRVMEMPFSGLITMIPQFSRIGAGVYCEPGQCAIVIPYRYELEKSVRLALYQGPDSDLLWNPGLGPIPAEPGRLRTPVEFPPDGSVIDLQSYRGGDLPNPLTACPGFSAPTGIPIVLQLGEGYGTDGSVQLTEHSISRDGVALDHCLITAASYRGASDEQTEIGKRGLEMTGSAIMLPLHPLAPGHYQALMAEDSKRQEWSFTIESPKSAEVKLHK